ncbi:hypothetical protein CRI94_02170 [Longibacter salinarum]|uniref:Uncharacterized protein n=1 Tax=Longibacter salinarum TaxID=1850348 RepID=A0A2A8D2F8_9BACT|nr:hypothetical protein [Longibacter salinarum]PEN15116.1 hypothetical protein CRI94_02170 [Longibacter salinarum]
MATGYSAYVINETRYPDLSACPWVERILVSALLFEYGVPDDDAPPEVLELTYDSDLLFPSLRTIEVHSSDIDDLFTSEERIAIFEDGRPLPPSVCDRVLGHLIVDYAIDTEKTDASTRFLLQSTLSSAEDIFFDRLQQAIEDGEVRLKSVRVDSFYGTHVLISDNASETPSIDVRTYPMEDLQGLIPNSPSTSTIDKERGRTSRTSDAVESSENASPDAVREQAARDIEQLEKTVDDDHDFGAGYDFRPDHPDDDGMGIDTPDEFEGRPDAEHEAVSMTSSSDYVFGPLRSIEEEIGSPTTYVFGPTRSLEEDLGGGVSKSWAKTLEEVAFKEDTSASYADTYDFNTQDKYDFTPPEYDITPEDGDDSDEMGEDVPEDEPDSWSTRPAVATDAEIDTEAVGAEVVGEVRTPRAHRRATTNEPLGLATLIQLIFVATILAGLLLLVLLY